MRLYNTQSRSVEELAAEGEVKIYVCGVTPYSRSHLGHAMSAIVFDVLRRYLEFRGLRTLHVSNYTDIDDKLINRANETGTTVKDLAERHIAELEGEMEELNVLPPHVRPRATEEIAGMLDIIAGLVESGKAYESGGDVYYRVRTFPTYGSLSGKRVDELRSGARVEVGELKEDAVDFALWKSAKPGEPSWDSPWGKGRPGWHIECSAMAIRYLGETLDIHGGGEDLIFPHHENEIAQSEAYTGKPFSHWWMHHGWMQLGGEKMSKSIGNIISIEDGLRTYGADAIRLFVVNSHYRSPLVYSEEGLQAARSGAARLRQAARRPGAPGGEGQVDPEPFRGRFIEAMDDDLNTPRALASLFDLAREINKRIDDGALTEAAQGTLLELAGVLGLRLEEGQEGGDIGPFVELLIELRADLRQKREFELADRLRSRLSDLGVALEDSPDGTTWRIESLAGP
ncbi:MAG: cysteine--tRNA ligase [Dehalococcoidia bacterium]|nr:cysteine--tRNA ligase [Dehalococcoidia bacterium]